MPPSFPQTFAQSREARSVQCSGPVPWYRGMPSWARSQAAGGGGGVWWHGRVWPYSLWISLPLACPSTPWCAAVGRGTSGGFWRESTSSPDTSCSSPTYSTPISRSFFCLLCLLCLFYLFLCLYVIFFFCSCFIILMFSVFFLFQSWCVSSFPLIKVKPLYYLVLYKVLVVPCYTFCCFFILSHLQVVLCIFPLVTFSESEYFSARFIFV